MIELNVAKTLGAHPEKIQLNLQITVPKGQFIALYGVSGAGKTSTLRLLSGLLVPDTGRITVNDRLWFDAERKVDLPVQERKVGYVFQDHALFPNMTARENLQFALRKGQDEAVIEEMTDLMELHDFLNRKPNALSGGQKQRVALARALVQRPEILLLDEPFSALDHKMGLKLQEYLLKIHRTYKLTTILISHNIGEIVKLCDHVFELDQGRVVREGPTMDFFASEKSSAKFRFTGEVLQVAREGVITVVSVLIGNVLVKVVADREEAEQFQVGDRVFVASKAFNPVIEKI